MDIEAEVVEMKQMLIDISKRIDDVLDESLTAALMKLSEESISELYKDEPDLYSVEDLKVRYNRYNGKSGINSVQWNHGFSTFRFTHLK